MSAYNLSYVKVEDPYSYVALAAIRQTFKDIECYFLHEGTPEEIEEGKRSIRWILKMEGNFRVLSSACGMPIENFHQACIEQINFLKQKAYENKTHKKTMSRL